MFSFKKKPSIEAEVLKHVGQPYIIFSETGEFLRGHPKVSEVLWNLGLGENEMQSRAALISGLKSQEMQNYDECARQILHEQLLLENSTNFSGIAEYDGCYILAQIKDTEAGSYALFKDVTNDYFLLSSGNRLSFDTTTMLGVLQNLPCGVLICDARDDNFPILCANQSFFKSIDVKNSDIQGKPFLEILSRYFYHRDLYEMMNGFIADPAKVSLDIERQYDGFHQWIRLSAHPVLNEGELPAYFIITVEDLTATKTRQAQENQSYKMEMLGQLSSGVTHDFNNMLSVVEGYARMIKKDHAEIEDIGQRVDYILDSVTKASSLTRQVMNYGKQVRMKPEVLNLGDLIDELRPLFKPLLNEMIIFSLDVAEGVYVRCAPDHMIQVLMNLIVNARDAMDQKGGRLLLSLIHIVGEDKEPYAQLVVRDEGCGMSEEVQLRIFDPYYTTKDNSKGTGLGMSTVQGLVKKMNAGIQIESEEGVGTSIILQIPLSADQPVANTKKDTLLNDNAPLAGITVMLVEDDEALLKSSCQVLESYGANVLPALNGNMALEIQENYDNEIDVLLTDIVMPDLSGVRLCELFESVRPQTNVVFFSGYPQAGPASSIVIPDNIPFLQKPIDYEQFMQIVLDFKNTNTVLPYGSVGDDQKASELSDQESRETLYSIAGNV